MTVTAIATVLPTASESVKVHDPPATAKTVIVAPLTAALTIPLQPEAVYGCVPPVSATVWFELAPAPNVRLVAELDNGVAVGLGIAVGVAVGAGLAVEVGLATGVGLAGVTGLAGGTIDASWQQPAMSAAKTKTPVFAWKRASRIRV